MKGDEIRNLIIAIGDTGAGKSTLLNSLILGHQSLGKRRLARIGTVIDIKNEDDSIFKIGHSHSRSETFLPKFHKIDNSKD